MASGEQPSEKEKNYDEQEKKAMSGDDLDGYKVELYIYDLSKGLARTMSPALLGKQLEGVWHTGVVAYGREYFFSSAGIESCRPGGTLLGEPDRIEELGESQVPYQLFLEYIFGLGESSYKPGAYNLFKHNCNNFSDEISQFLCGQGIPKSILQLPEEVLNTPLGESLSKIVQDLQLKTSQAKGVNFANFNNNNVNNFIPTPFTNRPRDDPELDELDDAIEEIRNNTIILEDRRNSLNEKLSKRLKKERKKEKKERKEKKKKTTIEGEDNDKKKKKKHKRVDSLEESEFVRSRSGSAALPPICPNQPSTSRDNSQSEVQLTSDIADEVVEIAELTKQLSAISVDRTNIPIVSPNTESSEQIPQTNSIVGSTNPNIPETTMADPQEERIEATAAPVVQPLGDPEPEVEREPPIVFKDEVDVSRCDRLEAKDDMCSSLMSCSPQSCLSYSSTSTYSSSSDSIISLSSCSSSCSSSSISYSSSKSSVSSSESDHNNNQSILQNESNSSLNSIALPTNKIVTDTVSVDNTDQTCIDEADTSIYDSCIDDEFDIGSSVSLAIDDVDAFLDEIEEPIPIARNPQCENKADRWSFYLSTEFSKPSSFSSIYSDRSRSVSAEPSPNISRSTSKEIEQKNIACSVATALEKNPNVCKKPPKSANPSSKKDIPKAKEKRKEAKSAHISDSGYSSQKIECSSKSSLQTIGSSVFSDTNLDLPEENIGETCSKSNQETHSGNKNSNDTSSKQDKFYKTQPRMQENKPKSVKKTEEILQNITNRDPNSKIKNFVPPTIHNKRKSSNKIAEELKFIREKMKNQNVKEPKMTPQNYKTHHKDDKEIDTETKKQKWKIDKEIDKSSKPIDTPKLPKNKSEPAEENLNFDLLDGVSPNNHEKHITQRSLIKKEIDKSRNPLDSNKNTPNNDNANEILSKSNSNSKKNPIQPVITESERNKTNAGQNEKNSANNVQAAPHICSESNKSNNHSAYQNKENQTTSNTEHKIECSAQSTRPKVLTKKNEEKNDTEIKKITHKRPISLNIDKDIKSESINDLSPQIEYKRKLPISASSPALRNLNLIAKQQIKEQEKHINKHKKSEDLSNEDETERICQPPKYTEPSSSNISCISESSNSYQSLACDSDVSGSCDSVLTRSDTESSVGSTMSFGSSYYMLYVVDPIERPRTPEEYLSSMEDDPIEEEIDSILKSESTCSIDSMRTITPEPEYFEENTRAFRALRGLSHSSSNDSLLTCLTHQCSTKSSDTLMHISESESGSRTSLSSKHNITFDKTKTLPTILSSNSFTTFRSQPTSPVGSPLHLLSRACSLESMGSFLKHLPRAPSPFSSISNFELTHSPPSEGSFATFASDRPPSTDSPIMFASPGGSHRGSQDSLVLYRPLPRYSNRSGAQSISPEPEATVLCYLGPARPYEPPAVFYDVLDQTRDAFDHFVEACAHMLTPDEQHHMEELRAYVVEDEGSWALGENFSILFFRVFHDPSIPDAARLHLLRIMAAAALKDDVILLLHQDRKEHTIMNYANKVESVIPEIQEALALFFCNMFEHLSPSEWLLYISEWDNGGQQISNIRVTTKIAVNALLHSNAKVQALGTALMYNLGTKEVKTVVFDDVAPELAMAILQYLNSHPEEEQLWRSMTALCRFCYASSEVPMLVKMIGPSPDAFKGVSERVDNIIEEINIKLSRVRGF